jgi:hypothetical protein
MSENSPAISENGDSPSSSLNWGWLIGCWVGGGLLILLAFVFQTVWHWVGAIIELLVEAGVALAFVGLAFLFERRFVRGIARAAAGAAEEMFAQRTRDLETRVDELTTAVQQRNQEAAQNQDSLVEALDYPTYQNIMEILEEADKLQAVAGSWVGPEVTVAASPDRDLLSVGFFRYHIVLNPSTFTLEVTARPHAHARNRPTPPLQLRWNNSESAEEFGHRFSQQLLTSGMLDNPDDFDWSLASANLKKSLDIAFRSRRREAGAWLLDGRLYELLGDDWAVTTAGLEHRPEPKFNLPAADFLRRPTSGIDRSPEDIRQFLRGERPDWCSTDDWEWLISIAQEHLMK